MKNIGHRFTVLADQSGMQLTIAGARYIEGECIPGLAQVVISHAQALELGNALLELAQENKASITSGDDAPPHAVSTIRESVDTALAAAREAAGIRRDPPWEAA